MFGLAVHFYCWAWWWRDMGYDTRYDTGCACVGCRAARLEEEEFWGEVDKETT